MAVGDCGIPLGLSTVDGLSRFDRANYSIVKIIRHIAGDADVDCQLELEVSEQIGKRLKKTSGNFYVPTRIRSGLDTKTNAAGAFTVETELLDLIELLRARTLVVRMAWPRYMQIGLSKEQRGCENRKGNRTLRWKYRYLRHSPQSLSARQLSTNPS